MPEYHVTCKETSSKKKVVVEGKQNVVSAIQSKFNIDYDIIIQQPYEDDWLDVETMDELNDGGKLQFIRNPATGATEDIIPVATCSTPTTSVPTTPIASTPIGFECYSLPVFPPDIAHSLSLGSTVIATSRADRSRIIQVLYDDLRARVGLYASNQHVKSVCSALVMTYPCLQDKVKIGQATTRYHTWFESLRQKFKDKRRTLTSDEQVQAMKAKYGGRAANRQKTDPLDIPETPRSKIPRLGNQCMDNDEEDEHSIQQHITTMQQMDKRNCDVSVISDRMARTYSHRRHFIQSGGKLLDVLQMYPALKDAAQLKAEFVRMTGIDMVDCLQKFWTARRVDIALGRLLADKVARETVSRAQETNVLVISLQKWLNRSRCRLGCGLRWAEGRMCYVGCTLAQPEDKQNVVMHVLPRLFGERLLCWSVNADEDDDLQAANKLTVYPTVVVVSDRLMLYFERTCICQTVSMLEAAATIIMIYFVFDVEYPSQLVNTCNFLDACVGRIDKKLKVRSCVQRKINILLA